MAGTLVHLAIAHELLTQFDVTPALFLAGNIVPDGIQSREGYERPMKMHTHFRDDIPDNHFTEPQNLSLFHKRIHDFITYQKSISGYKRDLICGYVSHVLTDEFFMCSIRKEFLQMMRQIGMTTDNPELFVRFSYDTEQLDLRLATEYKGMQEIYRLLSNIEPYEIPGYLSEQELTKSRHYILDRYFESGTEPKTPQYISYERILDFISEAVQFVEKVIKKDYPEL